MDAFKGPGADQAAGPGASIAPLISVLPSNSRIPGVEIMLLLPPQVPLNLCQREHLPLPDPAAKIANHHVSRFPDSDLSSTYQPSRYKP